VAITQRNNQNGVRAIEMMTAILTSLAEVIKMNNRLKDMHKRECAETGANW
jgi:hypothetical protein